MLPESFDNYPYLADEPINQTKPPVGPGWEGKGDGARAPACAPLAPLPGARGVLTGLLGCDVDRGAGGPRPAGVVGSHGGKVDGVGPQPCDGLGGDVSADSDLTDHGFPGVVRPVQDLVTETERAVKVPLPPANHSR